MDPTTIFCPNLACPARDQTGQGNLRIHSRKDRRFMWVLSRNFTPAGFSVCSSSAARPGRERESMD